MSKYFFAMVDVIISQSAIPVIFFTSCFTVYVHWDDCITDYIL